MPPEKVFTGRSAAATRSKRSSNSSARAASDLRGSWVSRPMRRRFSRAVRFSSTAAYWPARPMRVRTVSASVTTS